MLLVSIFVKDGLKKSEALYSWFKGKYSLKADMPLRTSTWERSGEDIYSAQAPLGDFGHHSDLKVPFPTVSL